MIGPTGAVRVMMATRPVDFRKGRDPRREIAEWWLFPAVLNLKRDAALECIAFPMP
jgi:hypothetical protein